MLKSFIGADMRLYEWFGVGLHNNPDFEKCTKCQGMTLPDAPQHRPEIKGYE